MTLTEQWKKGELEQGEYWCEITESPYVERVYLPCCDDIIVEVLAPVPSYVEWKASEKYNKHLEEKIKVYERKEKQHTDDAIAYNELAKENEELKEILERHKKATAKAQIRSCDLEIINAQLKELLKKARDLIRQIDWCESFYAYNDGLDEEINKALGEDK